MALIDDIRALPSEVLATKDVATIAAALPVPVKLVPYEFGVGTILVIAGLEVGNTVIDAIIANTEFRHVVPLMNDGRLDASLPLVRDTFDTIVASNIGFTVAHANALKALAEQPNPVSEYDVLTTCWSETGVWLI